MINLTKGNMNAIIFHSRFNDIELEHHIVKDVVKDLKMEKRGGFIL